MSETNTQPPNTESPESISLNDLQVILQIVDAAAERGAFKGEELSSVGAVRDKLSAFLTFVAQAQEEQRAKEEAVEQKRQEILMAKQEAEEQLARRVEIIARTRLQAANDGVRQRADKLQKEQEAREAAQKVCEARFGRITSHFL